MASVHDIEFFRDVFIVGENQRELPGFHTAFDSCANFIHRVIRDKQKPDISLTQRPLEIQEVVEAKLQHPSLEPGQIFHRVTCQDFLLGWI